MGPSGTSGTTTGGPSAHDAAFADMIEGLKNEAVNRGSDLTHGRGSWHVGRS